MLDDRRVTGLSAGLDPATIDAVVFDIGGVFVIRHHEPIRRGLGRAGFELPEDPEVYHRAHHVAVRAMSDLVAEVIRTPAAAELSFSDDPLRMLRAARFASQLGFVPAPEVVTAMRAMAPRLEIFSAERIRDELVKLLLTDDPPKHTRVRAVVSNALSPKALNHMAENFRADARALVNSLKAN